MSILRGKKEEAKRAERPGHREGRTEDRPFRPRELGEFKDKFSIRGMDPNYEYHFFLDKDGPTGHRIATALEAGWSMVDATSERLSIGDAAIQNHERFGSLYRIPANKDGIYYYLMKMPKEWWEQIERDKAAKAQAIDDQIYGKRDPDVDGFYGQIKAEEAMVRGRHNDRD